jgi:hypothetical protein
MDTGTDQAMDNDFDDSEDYDTTPELVLLGDDSEIDGDCNESQLFRGDEPWLTQDLLDDVD